VKGIEGDRGERKNKQKKDGGREKEKKWEE